MANLFRPWATYYTDWLQKNVTPDFETGHLYYSKNHRKAGQRLGKAITTVKSKSGNRGYYNFAIPGDGKQLPRITVKVHTVIFWFYHKRFPIGYIDHISGNSLDNRPENLREVTPSQNSCNSRKRSDIRATSDYKAVTISKGVYRSLIKVPDYKVLSLPVTQNEIEAAKMYDLASIVLHGDYGYRNFPDDTYKQSQIDEMGRYIRSKIKHQQAGIKGNFSSKGYNFQLT